MASKDFNFEKELESCAWIMDKIKQSEIYRQNLYAALCNNSFQKLDTWPILKDEVYSCSWRYAGGLVSDLFGSGDYLDYYCSGLLSLTDDEIVNQEKKFVEEGIITQEIEQDLKKLGWVCKN